MSFERNSSSIPGAKKKGFSIKALTYYLSHTPLYMNCMFHWPHSPFLWDLGFEFIELFTEDCAHSCQAYFFKHLRHTGCHNRRRSFWWSRFFNVFNRGLNVMPVLGQGLVSWRKASKDYQVNESAIMGRIVSTLCTLPEYVCTTWRMEKLYFVLHKIWKLIAFRKSGRERDFSPSSWPKASFPGANSIALLWELLYKEKSLLRRRDPWLRRHFHTCVSTELPSYRT